MPKFFKKVFFFSISSWEAFKASLKLIITMVLCLLSLVFFFKVASEVVEAEFTSMDVAISLFVYSFRTPLLTQLMLLITSLGNEVSLILTAIISIIFLIKKHRKEAVLFCIVLLMGLILNIFLKQTYQRPRPNISPLITEMNYSFPSGHAMNSFIFFALLAYFSHHFFHKKSLTILSTVIAIILILLIGMSRIYLGVHYFTDVIAGYIAGFWWFITVLLIERLLIFYKFYKKHE